MRESAKKSAATSGRKMRLTTGGGRQGGREGAREGGREGGREAREGGKRTSHDEGDVVKKRTRREAKEEGKEGEKPVTKRVWEPRKQK